MLKSLLVLGVLVVNFGERYKEKVMGIKKGVFIIIYSSLEVWLKIECWGIIGVIYSCM